MLSAICWISSTATGRGSLVTAASSVSAARPRSTTLTPRLASVSSSRMRMTSLLDVVRRHRARRPRRWVLTVAAAGVVALGAAGLVLDVWRDTRDPAADAPGVKASQSPVDPPGPLYVLPAELADVDNPFVESQALQPYSGLVIGQRSGEGFRNPVHVTVLDGPPVDVEDTWTPVEVATGVAYVRHDGPVMRVAEQRGDGWLLITGDDTDGQVRTDLLDGLTISADGTIDVDAGIDVVGRFAGTAAGTAYSTYLELGDGIVVETATVAESLSVVALGGADTLTAIVIHGTQAWLSTRQDQDGQWHGVVWMASPNRMIAVSGTGPLGAVLDTAASLQTVTEHEWVTVTGWNGE